MTQTEVVFILSVLFQQNIIHLLLQVVSVSSCVVLNVLLLNSFNLLVDFTCFNIFFGFVHIPVVVLALERISAWLGHSSESSEFACVTGNVSRLILT